MADSANNSVDTAKNYQNVLNEMTEVLRKSGRDSNACTLIAVSKTKPVEMMLPVYEAGCRDFGENKVQEIMDKYDKMPSDVRWHMIGHLQTNKIKYIIDKVYMIHSVDSLHLAEAISKEAVKKNVTARILLEVNVAKEESKFGVTLEETAELYKNVCKLPNLSVEGLMTIAPYVEDAEENRQYFANLRQLSVDTGIKKTDNNIGAELSMGMSGDYIVAIEEGATFIRVGTGIFGERVYVV
ncbi:MAG: YggS family pyridoxal phosphate-dependent enzyme [Lachnospiraceae bacterium]|nr:YggS family pyridoxal phosphate-dependent enzyme [Lachnospiraceae bacterium]